MNRAAPEDRPAYFEGMDAAGKKANDQARQILETTRSYRSTADEDLVVLDAGSGYGYTAVALAAKCRSVVAIEPSPGLFELSRTVTQQMANIELRQQSLTAIQDESRYDLIVLDNVLEHIPDQPTALSSAHKALRPGGLLYILVPNRLWPIEAHYGLPFLSYLPLPLANRYLRLTRRGTSYEDASYAPTYGRLVRLLDAAQLEYHFVIPGDLSLTVEGAALHYRLGAAMLRRVPALWRLAKGFLVIARKR